MRRRPNPWIAIPSIAFGLLAAALAWTVTDVSCRGIDSTGSPTTCPGWMVLASVASFALVTVGMAVILSLVYRSLAEAKSPRDRDQ